MKQLFAILGIIVLLTGCASQAAQLPSYYQREFVAGNPQQRRFEFSEITGRYEELITIEDAEELSIKASLTQGNLVGEVISPDGIILFNILLSGDMVTLGNIPGPFPSGTYILRFDAAQAKGVVKVAFKGK